jgi:hypothetical protein
LISPANARAPAISWTNGLKITGKTLTTHLGCAMLA